MFFLFLLLSVFTTDGAAQEDTRLDRLREKWIGTQRDSIQVDSLSIDSSSFRVFKPNEKGLADSLYELRPFQGVLILKGKVPDTLLVRYRVLPLNFSAPQYHKNRDRIASGDVEKIDPYTYRADQQREKPRPFNLGNLDKKGNISRGLNFGNKQDLSVNSNLNLELSGPLSDKVNVEASVTDDNIPVQPEGNTQKLQDFDKVFVRFYNDRHRLIAGDARIEKDSGQYLRYSKRIKGADLKSSFPLEKKKEGEKRGEITAKASGAISKGKFARNVIRGIEGNQGPYQLKGANNEEFIVVLAGTERVYLDGKLLQRGADNDYTIDYNAAEITFTPQHMIKKESRIKVEFQYSERNYARSLFRASTQYQDDGVEMSLDIYSEQDAKNQPLQQDLSDKEIARLEKAGDDPADAVVPGVEKQSSYNNSEVRYRMTDSLGYDSVFVHSSDPSEALFRIRFSEVGQGNGNYVKAKITPNGRAFRWVPPDTVGGELRPQGNYAPVIPLEPPELKRMATYTAALDLSDHTLLQLETAVSEQDVNRFSPEDEGDNAGGAVKVGLEQKLPFQADRDSGWIWKGDLQWEYVHRQFQPIQRIRDVEFARNWNIRDRKLTRSRQLGDLGFDLRKKGVGKAGYSYQHFFSGKRFMKGGEFRGEKHQVKSDLHHKGFLLDGQGSILRTKGRGKSKFSRHKAKVEKSLPFIVLGYKDEHENNRRYKANGVLREDSYRFYEWEAYAGNPDTSGNEYRLYYGQRKDRYGKSGKLDPGTFIKEYGLSFHLKEHPQHRLNGKLGYRRLNVVDETLVEQKPENSLVNRIEHRWHALQGAIDVSTFYQLGSGTERRKEFIYLKVPAGQGAYTWNDYNSNGVKELNEFEVARYSDQGRYIRSFIRGDDYVQTFSNTFQHTLNIKPARAWGQKDGIKGFLSRFSEQMAYSVERKTSGNTPPRIAYDPFKQDLPDTTLLSMNSNFRNSVFFNRADPVWGLEHTYKDVRDRSLLASGFQERVEWSHEGNARYNFQRKWGVECKGRYGVERNRSDVLDGRNYRIEERSVEPQLRYQPSTTFRLALKGGYSEKKNDERFGGERAILRDLEGRFKYNSAGKGTFRVKLRYIDVRYQGEANNSTAFRMLESLEKGDNLTWTVRIQRNLSKHLQMNLNYNGRSSQGEPPVHNGSVQVRAFF
ncbi:MAG: hypothetical protein ABEH38_01350 [Flavobacteriales bacterium]